MRTLKMGACMLTILLLLGSCSTTVNDMKRYRYHWMIDEASQLNSYEENQLVMGLLDDELEGGMLHLSSSFESADVLLKLDLQKTSSPVPGFEFYRRYEQESSTTYWVHPPKELREVFFMRISMIDAQDYRSLGLETIIDMREYSIPISAIHRDLGIFDLAAGLAPSVVRKDPLEFGHH